MGTSGPVDAARYRRGARFLRQKVRRVLARKRGCAELPIDGAGSAVDHHDRGDVAETHKQVSVGHLGDCVGDGPHVAIILDGRDHVVLGIQVLPASPFPYNLSFDRHLDEVRRVHLSIVVLRAGPATPHLGNNLGGKRLLADQKNISISQANAIVIVIGMVHLPQNPSAPIHFQRGTAPIGSLPNVALVRNLAVVEERATLGEISGLTGWVGHIPRVDDVAEHIDQVHSFVGGRQRTKQREAREGALRVVAAQADAAPLDR